MAPTDSLQRVKLSSMGETCRCKLGDLRVQPHRIARVATPNRPCQKAVSHTAPVSSPLEERKIGIEWVAALLLDTRGYGSHGGRSQAL